MEKNKIVMQLVWGAALVAAGIGVFYRIPQVMPRIAAIEQFSASKGFVTFCFYLMGVLLVGGGARKIVTNYKKLKSSEPTE